MVGVEEGYAAENTAKIGIWDEKKGCIKWARKRRREEVNEWTAATLTSGPRFREEKQPKMGSLVNFGCGPLGGLVFFECFTKKLLSGEGKNGVT